VINTSSGIPEFLLAAIAEVDMARTLSKEDVAAVAAEVVRQIRPMLGIEGHVVDYSEDERVSGRRGAEISAQAQAVVAQMRGRRGNGG
jgi:hypothetical protein